MLLLTYVGQTVGVGLKKYCVDVKKEKVFILRFRIKGTLFSE